MDLEELKRLVSEPEHEDVFFETLIDILLSLCLIGILVFCLATVN